MTLEHLLIWAAIAFTFVCYAYSTKQFSKGGKEIANLLNDLDARIKHLDKRVTWLERLTEVQKRLDDRVSFIEKLNNLK